MQEPNLPEYGGKLSVRMSYERISSMMDMMPVVVARQNGVVVGYLISSQLSLYADVPVIQAMLAEYKGSPGAYVYGPICVAKDHRQNGLAGAMFNTLRESLPNREGFTFVRKDNATSMTTHSHIGLKEVGTFTFNDAEHAIFAYMGKA